MPDTIQLSNTSLEKLDKLVKKQRTFFDSNQTYDLAWRKKQLQNLKKAIRSREEEVYTALQKDLGKSMAETFASELAFVLKEIDFTLKNLQRWALPESVPTPLFLQISSSKIHFVPKGLTLLISPWNYPFQLAMSPLIGALAAGNCAILKPSEDAPHTAKLIESIVEQVFDSDHVAVAQGDGQTVVGHLLNNHSFDHVFFTGSTRVGKIIMQMAAARLSPVTLELGGKSPGIIDRSVNLQVAARRLTWGKFYNTGQTCVAPDYLLVHESLKDKAVQLIKENIVQFYGKDALQSPDYGRMIHQRAWNRMDKLIRDHKDHIIYGGNVVADQLYVEPTLVEIEDFSSSLMQEEIFGPVWPIVTWKDEKQLFDILKKNPNPLAAYLFTKNNRLWKKFVQFFPCGGACKNNCVVHLANPHLPFGGIGNSGIGNYHGKYSFKTFSHEKGVLRTTNWPDPGIKYPPYKGKIKWLRQLLK